MAIPGKAIEAARLRRLGRASQQTKDIEWFIDDVSATVELAMSKRVRLATEFLKSKVIVNISRPVTKTRVSAGGRKKKTVVTNRSKPGEFPKADTTQLMKTIFGIVKSKKGSADGYVGTPLDYGLILEVSKGLNRSFLRRSLKEERIRIIKILTGPIKGRKVVGSGVR